MLSRLKSFFDINKKDLLFEVSTADDLKTYGGHIGQRALSEHSNFDATANPRAQHRED